MTPRQLFLLVLSACITVACSVDDPPIAGRPCSDQQPCGPGTTCDPVSKTCQADAADGGGDRGATADNAVPDTLQPDSIVAPDGGCPKGLTRCGNVCVKLLSDVRHCGACNSACSSSRADSCVAGKCSCGKTGKVCAPSLNCKSGTCTCVASGNCKGCCWGATCRALGSAQSASTCGKNGAPCANCIDGNDCTTATCTSSGSCAKTNKANGTTCDDKAACTRDDTCSAGTCKGTPYACKASTCQASSTCDGKGGCKVTLKANNTPCSDGVSCTHGDKCASGVCKGTTYTCTPGTCQASATCNGSGGCLTTAMSDGTSCSDGDPCTWGDKCVSGQCKGAAYSCVDALSCTQDSCLGTGPPPTGCKHALLSGYCAISGKCYSTGMSNPSNGCQKCVPTSSTTSWTGTSGGCVSTLAGTGASSIMWNPSDVAVSSTGDVYVVDRANSRILVISAGKVSTFAGTGAAGYLDGAAAVARFNKPQGIAVSGSGRVFVADRYNHAVRMIVGGQVTTIGGKGGTSGYYDGAASGSLFYDPHDVEVDSNGAVFVADTGNRRVRKILSQQVTTVAGSGLSGFADGSALQQAKFAHVYGIALDSSGAIYVADGGNHRIRKVHAGVVSTVAGTGTIGLLNGAASVAAFYYPQGVAVGASGTLYVADRNNNVIRKISGGVVSTFAGSGVSGFADGSLTQAMFKSPFGLCHASNGKIFVADYSNNRIRLISP